MIKKYDVYGVTNRDLIVNEPKLDFSHFSPTVIPENTMRSLWDSLQGRELYVEYKHFYTGYDGDDDISESNSKTLKIEDLVKNSLCVGIISVDAAIVVDNDNSFVGILLDCDDNYHFISPFVSAHQVVELNKREKSYDHREYETFAKLTAR